MVSIARWYQPRHVVTRKRTPSRRFVMHRDALHSLCAAALLMAFVVSPARLTAQTPVGTAGIAAAKASPELVGSLAK
jgi:hypothetical protein